MFLKNQLDKSKYSSKTNKNVQLKSWYFVQKIFGKKKRRKYFKIKYSGIKSGNFSYCCVNNYLKIKLSFFY